MGFVGDAATQNRKHGTETNTSRKKILITGVRRVLPSLAMTWGPQAGGPEMIEIALGGVGLLFMSIPRCISIIDDSVSSNSLELLREAYRILSEQIQT